MSISINHVHLGSRDVKRSQEFYSRYFGFRRKSEHGHGVFLVNDENFLIAVDPVDSLPKMPDWYHLGFCLDSSDQVLKLYEMLKASGENIVRELKVSDGLFASFFVNDPDGNRLEISWHND